MDKGRKRAKKIFQNSLLLLTSVSLVLIISEGFLRIFSYSKEDTLLRKQRTLRQESSYVFYKYDRYLGWKNKPLAEGYFTTPDCKVFIKINSKGLRDKEYTYDKQRDVFRILVLGDSFTWGHGVEMEEIFTERLEKMLGEKAEVINAGVAGYGTDQELLFLEREGWKYSPDIVLVAFGTADVEWDNRVDMHGYYPKPLFGMKDQQLKLTNVPLPEMAEDTWEELVKKDSISLKNEYGKKLDFKKKGLKGFLKNKTKIYPFISKSFKRLKYRLLSNLRLNPELAKKIDKIRLSYGNDNKNLQTTKAMFLRMKECTQTIGAKLVVLIIPYKCALEKLPDASISEFIDFFEQNDIPCLFSYQKFLEKFRAGEKLYFDHNDHHWNPKAHLLAAEELYWFLEKERLIAHQRGHEE